MTITWDEFAAVGLVLGTVVRVEDFPEARKPAYKLWIDIGEGDVKRSSAQITHHYTKDALVGKQVICVTGFAPRQVGPFLSEVLVTGFYDANGQVVLAVPDPTIAASTSLARGAKLA